MRGRLASFAIGGAIARRRSNNAYQQQSEYQNQFNQQQMEIERLKAQQAQSAQYQPQQYQPQQNSDNQVDVTQQLQKFAELHQKGALTDSEFQQLKMKLLSQM